VGRYAGVGAVVLARDEGTGDLRQVVWCHESHATAGTQPAERVHVPDEVGGIQVSRERRPLGREVSNGVGGARGNDHEAAEAHLRLVRQDGPELVVTRPWLAAV